MEFGEFLLGLLVITGMIFFFMILFFVLVDLFRDKELSGWWKAVWIVVFLIFPFLGVLIYLIARGGGMQQRSMKEAEEQKKAFDQYVRTVSGGQGGGAAAEIAQAKELLDSGAISQEEFDSLKSKALAGG